MDQYIAAWDMHVNVYEEQDLLGMHMQMSPHTGKLEGARRLGSARASTS